jgi:hypothetical protein
MCWFITTASVVCCGKPATDEDTGRRMQLKSRKQKIRIIQSRSLSFFCSAAMQQQNNSLVFDCRLKAGKEHTGFQYSK